MKRALFFLMLLAHLCLKSNGEDTILDALIKEERSKNSISNNNFVGKKNIEKIVEKLNSYFPDKLTINGFFADDQSKNGTYTRVDELGNVMPYYTNENGSLISWKVQERAYIYKWELTGEKGEYDALTDSFVLGSETVWKFNTYDNYQGIKISTDAEYFIDNEQKKMKMKIINSIQNSFVKVIPGSPITDKIKENDILVVKAVSFEEPVEEEQVEEEQVEEEQVKEGPVLKVKFQNPTNRDSISVDFDQDMFDSIHMLSDEELAELFTWLPAKEKLSNQNQDLEERIEQAEEYKSKIFKTHKQTLLNQKNIFKGKFNSLNESKLAESANKDEELQTTKSNHDTFQTDSKKKFEKTKSTMKDLQKSYDILIFIFLAVTFILVSIITYFYHNQNFEPVSDDRNAETQKDAHELTSDDVIDISSKMKNSKSKNNTENDHSEYDDFYTESRSEENY